MEQLHLHMHIPLCHTSRSLPLSQKRYFKSNCLAVKVAQLLDTERPGLAFQVGDPVRVLNCMDKNMKHASMHCVDQPPEDADTNQSIVIQSD